MIPRLFAVAMTDGYIASGHHDQLVQSTLLLMSYQSCQTNSAVNRVEDSISIIEYVATTWREKCISLRYIKVSLAKAMF